MADAKTDALLSSIMTSMAEACEKNRDEQCAKTLEEEVFSELDFMGYPHEIASEVAKVASDKLRELSKGVYWRNQTDSDCLTEEDQRAACKDAAEASGYIVTE